MLDQIFGVAFMLLALALAINYLKKRGRNDVSELEKDPKFRKWIEKLGLKWEDYIKHERDTKRALRNQYRREHGIPY